MGRRELEEARFLGGVEGYSAEYLLICACEKIIPETQKRTVMENDLCRSLVQRLQTDWAIAHHTPFHKH